MTVVGPRLVLDAVYAFLATGSGNRYSLNTEIDLYRAQESLTNVQMPDVVAFQKYAYLGSESPSATPIVGLEWDSSEGEALNNDRELTHRLSMYLLLLDRDVAGDEVYLAARVLDYVAVVQAMFLRGTYAGARGYTLNNGTGSSTARIMRATVDDVQRGYDDELNAANVLIRFGLTVVSIEDYPGT